MGGEEMTFKIHLQQGLRPCAADIGISAAVYTGVIGEVFQIARIDLLCEVFCIGSITF